MIPTSANAVQHRPQNNFRNNNNTNNKKYGNSSYNTSNSRPFKPYLGKCQICHTQGHSARRCPQFQGLQQQQMHPGNVNPFRPYQPRANVVMNSPYSAANWLLASGATHHITSDLNNMALHQPYNGGDDVLIADGISLPISHSGLATLSTPTRNLALKNILCVPNIEKNLISVYKLCNTNGVSVQFFPASFQVKDLSTGVPLLQGRTRNQLYEWPVSLPRAAAMITSSNPKTSLLSWHSRLGHPSLSILNSIVSQFSLPITSSEKQLSCSQCMINKSHRLPFTNSSISSSRPLEYIFTDVWSSPITSIDNFKYYLVFIDNYTRYRWLYPLRLKSQVKEVFIAYKSLVENKFNMSIGTLFSDNGGEYVALRSFLSQHGIAHLTSPSHTPQHNGMSERKHRHIVETGLTLLSTTSIPKTYWTYAFAAAVYLINRLPSPTISMQSPYCKLFGDKPNYEKLKVFGCLCFPWLRPYNTNKLQDRSKRCTFLGYSPTQSAYFD